MRGRPAEIILVLEEFASRSAIRWAAHTAACSGQPLRICGSEQSVKSAEVSVRHYFPHLRITADMAPVDDVLAGRRAGLIVRTCRRGWDLSPSPAEADFRGPMVFLTSHVRPDRPVVAVLDSADHQDVQTELAFRIAGWQDSAARIVAVYRRPPFGTWVGLPPGLDESLREQAVAQAKDVLKRWTGYFPRVSASLQVTSRPSEASALQMSRTGSLVVLRRDAEGLWRLLGQQILAAGHGSVAVTRLDDSEVRETS